MGEDCMKVLQTNLDRARSVHNIASIVARKENAEVIKIPQTNEKLAIRSGYLMDTSENVDFQTVNRLV